LGVPSFEEKNEWRWCAARAVSAPRAEMESGELEQVVAEANNIVGFVACASIVTAASAAGWHEVGVGQAGGGQPLLRGLGLTARCEWTGDHLLPSTGEPLPDRQTDIGDLRRH
jgi:hypothetical protein